MLFSKTAALASALFSSIAFAAPPPSPPSEAGWSTTATLQLSNDHSGAHAEVAIPIDGVKRPIQELYENTAVARHGLVFASSAQLVEFEQTTSCTIEEEGHLSETLDAENTWVSLGKPVVDLCSAWVVCECDWERMME